MKKIKTWGLILIFTSIVAILIHLTHMDERYGDVKSKIDILQILLELTVMGVGIKLALNKEK